MVEAAGERWPGNRSGEVGYGLSGVKLLDVVVDSTSGTAELTWTRYDGPDFESYEILRLQAGEGTMTSIERVTDVADTSFANEGLLPDTDYAYRVVVYAAGNTVQSNQLSRIRYGISPVDLLVVEEDRDTGSIRLRWSRYSGPGFHSYRVNRSIRGDLSTPLETTKATGDADTLETYTSIDDTTHVDLEAEANINYLYSVTVVAADTLISNSLEQKLTLLPVEITALTVDSATASATLRWSPYEGPRFKAYEIVRLIESGRRPIQSSRA